MRKLIGAFCLASVLAACGDSTGPAELTGTYQLHTWNGQSPPVVVWEDEEWRIEIVSGQFALGTEGACSSTLTGRATEKDTGDVTTDSHIEHCTYTVSGSTVRADFGDGEIVELVHAGNTLTYTESPGTADELVIVFRK